MARVASYRNADDDDYFGKMIDGIQTGIGIGQAFNQKKLSDKQMELTNQQLEETRYDFDEKKANRSTRDAESSTKKAEEEQKGVIARDAFNSSIGAASSYYQQSFLEQTQDAPDVAASKYSDYMRNLTDGRIDIQTAPVKNQDGSISYSATVNMGGKQAGSFNFNNPKEFSANITAMRNAAGMRDPETNQIFADNKEAFRRYREDGNPNATMSDFLALSKSNPKAFGNYLQTAIAGRTMGDQKKLDQDQGWKGEEHGARMSNYALSNAATRQSMGFAAEDQARDRVTWGREDEQYKYNIETLRPIAEYTARAALAGNKAKEAEGAVELMKAFDPSLQPIPVETNDPLAVDGLGVGGGKKVQYVQTPEQQQKISDVNAIYFGLPSTMDPVQKVQFSLKRYDEVQAELKRQKDEAARQAAANEAAKNKPAPQSNPIQTESVPKPTQSNSQASATVPSQYSNGSVPQGTVYVRGVPIPQKQTNDGHRQTIDPYAGETPAERARRLGFIGNSSGFGVGIPSGR